MGNSIYCYDTEFLEDGYTIDLISIGIVCDDGREYYAVNAGMPTDKIRAEEWLMANVWPHLPIVGRTDTHPGILDTRNVTMKPKFVIRNEVREFILTGGGDPQLWAYYAAYDHVVLAQLFGHMVNLPDGIPMYTNELRQEMVRHGVDAPAPDDQHNALADARWNLDVLRKCQAADRARTQRTAAAK